MTTVYAFLENCHLLSRIDQYFDLSSVFSILHVHEVYTTPQALQRWLYCREHLKYVWNFYCVVTNHMRDLHTTETTGHERFPSGHNKLFSFCYNIQFFFTSKQLLYFLLICFTVCAIIAKNIPRFERLWNKLQSRCAGRDACDGWQIGPKSTNHSPIEWRREG